MATLTLTTILGLAVTSHAHQVAWSKGMYCKNGISNTDMPNAAYVIDPLYNLTYDQWFLHGQCRNFPPPAGEYLNIPANGKFTVEITGNRAFTTLSYNGTKATAWGDGRVHPNNWSTNVSDPMYPPSSAGCLGSPNLHCHGQLDAAGTAFAIAYKNNINAVTMSDFTVFSVLPNTPYQRIATYSVPNLPTCPTGGCLCAWGWIPNHCGSSNIYMNAYRCQVTGASKTAKPVGTPKPPVWCESNPSTCVKGPKQLIAVWQADSNNFVLPPGVQKDGQWPSPGYNSKAGFTIAGAQTDIFISTTSTASAVSAAVAAVATDAAAIGSAALGTFATSGTVVDLPEQTNLSSSSARQVFASRWIPLLCTLSLALISGA